MQRRWRKCLAAPTSNGDYLHEDKAAELTFTVAINRKGEQDNA